MTHDLVGSSDDAVENIKRYQTEAREEPRLAGSMRRVRAWYAVKSDDGTWLFGPSKFIGYAENTAKAYLSATADNRDGRVIMDGGRTEAVLRRWFEAVPPDTRRAAELGDALRSFLETHGHSGPNKRARICVLKELPAGGAGAVNPDVRDRIHLDPAICGGRPHIRGTRVRVSDLLDLLAHGVSPPEILTDYPYLDEADLKAALAFGAAASAHRVILAA